MARVRLIHWNAAEAEERAARLRAAGHDVACDPFDRGAMIDLRREPPDAVVIDLARLPSQGRDLGLNIRKYKATRRVPLVFVDGDPGKVSRIRELLPDAVYTSWPEMGSALMRAIAHPPDDPVVPGSVMDSYLGTPLAKKLGIKAGGMVAIEGAPEGFEATLGKLPPGAEVRRDVAGHRDLTLWFVTSRRELEVAIERMGAFAGTGGLWIIWPKKASGLVTDVSQTVVREVGLAAGLVDYKVCAVDATWSGLRFTRRKRE